MQARLFLAASCVVFALDMSSVAWVAVPGMDDMLKEASLRANVASNARDPAAHYELGMWLAHKGSPEAKETLEITMQVAKSRGIKMTAMALHDEYGGLMGYLDALRKEDNEFREFCSKSDALAQAPDLRQSLPTALAEFRSLPQDDAWFVRWCVERAKFFGPDGGASTFGETHFSAWTQIMDNPDVQAVMNVKGQEAPPEVVIFGSAIGYQCLFFLAAGIPCVGYDILPDSLVGAGMEIVNRYGLHDSGMSLLVGDARSVPMAGDLRRPSMLWLNNEAWPADLRQDVLARAAGELAPGSIVVSYGQPDEQLPEALSAVKRLNVFTSWDPAEDMLILRKNA